MPTPRAYDLTTAPTPPPPLNKFGLLFEPITHEEALCLFSINHRDLGFPYIVSIGMEYPDVIVIDERKAKKE